MRKENVGDGVSKERDTGRVREQLMCRWTTIKSILLI